MKTIFHFFGLEDGTIELTVTDPKTGDDIKLTGKMKLIEEDFANDFVSKFMSMCDFVKIERAPQ